MTVKPEELWAYEGLRVYDYLGMTQEKFNDLPPGICRHPKCNRKTKSFEALCRWHGTAYNKWRDKNRLIKAETIIHNIQRIAPEVIETYEALEHEGTHTPENEKKRLEVIQVLKKVLGL